MPCSQSYQLNSIFLNNSAENDRSKVKSALIQSNKSLKTLTHLSHNPAKTSWILLLQNLSRENHAINKTKVFLHMFLWTRTILVKLATFKFWCFPSKVFTSLKAHSEIIRLEFFNPDIHSVLWLVADRMTYCSQHFWDRCKSLQRG